LSGYIWDGQYDGEEHEENAAQQAAAKPVLFTFILRFF